MAERTPVILARELEKHFGSLRAVDKINFSVHTGEVFGFLGPNGAGKTSTMKMIQCISPLTGGHLEVFGMDVERFPREIKRQLGVVPQETNLDPEFTVFENLMVFSRYFDIPRKEAQERIETLLEFMQLLEKRDVLIDKLSGGMKRRLLLARSLVNQPKLLIMDEPTIGLDPQARHLIWEKLKAVQNEGSTIVLTTHYLDEAERLCNRLVIMDLGRILVEGVPEDLVKNFVGSDIVEADNSPEVVDCLEHMGARYEVFGDMVQVFTDRPREVAKNLFDNCNPGRVFARRATLEDVFLSLTGRALKD
nr:ATP-binding cassette domain-containing protein [Methanolinea mesophila]